MVLNYDKYIKAVFKPIGQVTVNIEIIGEGTVDVYYENGTPYNGEAILEGTRLNYSMVADEFFAVINNRYDPVYDPIKTKTGSFEVTEEGEKTFTFVREESKVQISYESDHGGIISPDTHTDRGEAYFWKGTYIQLEAIPYSGYVIDEWLDKDSNVVGTSNVVCVQITEEDEHYLATFKPIEIGQDNQVFALANYREGGAVGGQGYYNEGDTATLKAYPQDGYDFVRWEIVTGVNAYSTVSTNNEFTITVEAGIQSYIAIFEPKAPKQMGEIIKIYVGRYGSGSAHLEKYGLDGPVSNPSGEYYAGELVYLVAEETSSATFVGWVDGLTGILLSTDMEIQIEVRKTVMYVAIFDNANVPEGYEVA